MTINTFHYQYLVYNGRNTRLDCPDCGNWNEKAEMLTKQGFQIAVSDYLEKNTTSKQKDQGFGLGEFLLENGKGYPPG